MFQFHCKESKTGTLWAMHAPSSLGVITSNVTLSRFGISIYYLCNFVTSVSVTICMPSSLFSKRWCPEPALLPCSMKRWQFRSEDMADGSNRKNAYVQEKEVMTEVFCQKRKLVLLCITIFPKTGWPYWLSKLRPAVE